MNRILFTLLIIISALASSFAQDQKFLNVQESTEGIGLLPTNDRHEALVQFVTSEPFQLHFVSSHDNVLDVKMDSVAGKKTYSIVFITQAPGQDYSRRRLTIQVPGFQDYRMPLPLHDKQKLVYTVSDPYSHLRSPFFNYLEKAQEDFRTDNYQSARDNYELCRFCPEFTNDSTNAANILNHITICDSMMQWNEQALQAENFHQFSKAEEFYRKMMRYNPSEFVRQQLFNTQSNFTNDCQSLINMGTNFFTQENYDRAQAMFEQVLDNGCSNEFTLEASTRLTEIRKAKMRRNDHARSFMLAWSPNMVGISWGNYYYSRANGWYGTFMLNNKAVDLAAFRSYVKGDVINDVVTDQFDNTTNVTSFDYENLVKDPKLNRGKYYPEDNKLDYEAMLAIGCSWHIWEPIFLHFGLGYHGGGFDTFDANNYVKAVEKFGKEDDTFDVSNPDTWTTGFRNDYSQINWFHGAAPEIGIALKYWRGIVKFTYQYTYWINNENYEDFLKKNTNNFQMCIGFCW